MVIGGSRRIVHTCFVNIATNIRSITLISLNIGAQKGSHDHHVTTCNLVHKLLLCLKPVAFIYKNGFLVMHCV